MQKILIFIAGMFCCVILLFAGAWTWGTLSGWLPYQRPDPALVAKVEALAAGHLPLDRDGNPLQIGKYRRWYVQGEQDRHQVIWGEWDIPNPTKNPLGIILGHQRFPPNSTFMFDSGCGQVHILYDIGKARLRSISCNARV